MALTPKQRQIWILHELDQVPQVEIARRLGRRPESVCRLVARANRTIRPLLTAFLNAGGDRAKFRELISASN